MCLGDFKTEIDINDWSASPSSPLPKGITDTYKVVACVQLIRYWGLLNQDASPSMTTDTVDCRGRNQLEKTF